MVTRSVLLFGPDIDYVEASRVLETRWLPALYRQFCRQSSVRIATKLWKAFSITAYHRSFHNSLWNINYSQTIYRGWIFNE